MSDIQSLRNLARRLDQTQTVERPGVVGFDSFYDAGTFTPTLVGSTIAGTFTYDATNTGGEWSRVGNRVFLNGRVRITAIAVAPTGNLRIGGLPIAGGAPAFGVSGGVAMLIWTGITVPAGYTQMATQVVNSSTVMALIRSGSNLAGAIVQGGELVLVGGVADLEFMGIYRV